VSTDVAERKYIPLDEMAQRATRGLTCPHCGFNGFWVEKTRLGPNLIRRWRVCRKCGAKSNTREVME
jgi:hypothetical protein